MNENLRFSFAQMSNADLIDKMYEKFLESPEMVDTSWRRFFEGMEFASQFPDKVEHIEGGDVRSYRLIEAYRIYGHLNADFDPIRTKDFPKIKELDPQHYGINDLSEIIDTQGILDKDKAPISEVLDRLREIYSNRIGFEYKHIKNTELQKFIQNKVEEKSSMDLSKDERERIFYYLNRAELFETFIHTKYVGQKRFSLEGLETFIPIVRTLLDHGGELGVDEALICTAHRGRLNILANIFEKPYSIVFHEFEEGYVPSTFEGSGDVKYHKGFSADIETSFGKRVHISIPPNSSHLESVDPVLQGQTRAKQTHKGDKERNRTLPIQVHGDASIAGQGVVYETMQFSKLEGYETGGSLHIILDNQIGFTTLPKDERSTTYCSDIATMFESPVFHVNAEDPEGCVKATKFAIELRQKFKCDVFIHLNGYRKYGHNEGDEPSYTQPLEYQLIRKKKTIREIYHQQLITSGLMEIDSITKMEKEFKEELQKEQESLKAPDRKEPEAEFVLGNRWSFWREAKLKDEKELFKVIDTKVDSERLKEIAVRMTEIPSDFEAHKKIAALLAMRRAAIVGDPKEKIMDWGLAENLAYGSILWEGYSVRIAGQDCCRGTFSHRHGMVVDQNNAHQYFPLAHLHEDQGLFTIYNSPLSEYASLAFEYGYSISTPKGLVFWEAQFGDFANGAQITIDAYIANSEEKWNRLSNLVMLLPHGYEGQGPEHSSARIERFLQLSGNKNLIVVNPTTPAQMFHLLRRQALRTFRKPLIVFTPKGLLRHKRCTSSVEELSEGQFHDVLDDPTDSKGASKLIFCSGRIFYDLQDRREKEKREDIAMIRIEQLYPVNEEVLSNIIKQYKNIKECIWFQEEPKNMGAWYFIRPIVNRLLPEKIELKYCGRERMAATATGSHIRHKQSHQEILDKVFKDKL